MTKNELIYEYYSNYPRVFFKILSLRYPFSKKQIIKYQDILELGAYGIKFNPLCDFDDELKNYFGKRIFTRNNSCEFENYSTIEEYRTARESVCLNNPSGFILTTYTDDYKNSCRAFINVKDIDFTFLKKNRNELNKWHWRIISLNYQHKIDFETLSEFGKDFNSIIVSNPNVDWSDVRIFNLYGRSWDICKYWLPYEIGLKPLLSDDFISEIIDYSLNNLPKKIKIIWAAPDKNKYLVKIYISGKGDDQCILGGYFYSKIKLTIYSELNLPANIIAIKNNNTISFSLHNIIINPFEILN